MASDSTIVLITGANAGIGYASTEVLTTSTPNGTSSDSSKYHVILASRNPDNGAKAASEIRALDGFKGSVSTVQLDVTDPSSVEKAAQSIEQEFGRVDVLVNNAGITSTAQDFPTNLVENFQVNVVGPARITSAFRHLLLKSSNPRSIYISSCMGSLSLATDPSTYFYEAQYESYRVSKAALNMLVAQDRSTNINSTSGGGKLIRTYAMCPGLVRSNLRGKGEDQISAGGNAGDPRESGKVLLDIIEGRREDDAGKLIKKDGVWEW